MSRAAVIVAPAAFRRRIGAPNGRAGPQMRFARRRLTSAAAHIPRHRAGAARVDRGCSCFAPARFRLRRAAPNCCAWPRARFVCCASAQRAPHRRATAAAGRAELLRGRQQDRSRRVPPPERRYTHLLRATRRRPEDTSTTRARERILTAHRGSLPRPGAGHVMR